MRWFFDTPQAGAPLSHSVQRSQPEELTATGESDVLNTLPKDEMSISETANLFNVTMRTLRFYEEKGLLSPRRIGNRRYYDETCRKRLHLVLKGKSMGLGLDAISSLVEAVESNAADDVRARDVRSLCEEQREMLIERRRTLDEQIEETQRALSDLENF